MEILAPTAGAWHVFRNIRQTEAILAHKKKLKGKKTSIARLSSLVRTPGGGHGARRTTAVIKCKKRLAFYFALAGCLLAGCCQGGAADGVGDDLGNELLHIH